MGTILKRLIRTIYHSLLGVRDRFFCKSKIGIYNPTWRFWGLPLFYKHKGSQITIGANFVSCSNSIRNSIGVNQKVIIKALSNNSVIKIGANVGLSGCTISAMNYIEIGDGTLVGSGVLITDNDSHPINPTDRNNNKLPNANPIIIGRNVFIGARSIILKGVVIGDGAVVGAGSVVTKNIPKLTIAVGNPAVVVKNVC